MPASDHLADLVLGDGDRDLLGVRLAADQGFREFMSLIDLDLCRHRRLEGIHQRPDDHGEQSRYWCCDSAPGG